VFFYSLVRMPLASLQFHMVALALQHEHAALWVLNPPRWRRSLKTDRHGSGIAGAFKRWVQSRLEKEERLSSCTHRLKEIYTSGSIDTLIRVLFLLMKLSSSVATMRHFFLWIYSSCVTGNLNLLAEVVSVCW
jgi:hypothetical protein